MELGSRKRAAKSNDSRTVSMGNITSSCVTNPILHTKTQRIDLQRRSREKLASGQDNPSKKQKKRVGDIVELSLSLSLSLGVCLSSPSLEGRGEREAIEGDGAGQVLVQSTSQSIQQSGLATS